MERKGIIVLTTAYILMFPVIFILPLFRKPEYSIIENTLSELGGQSEPDAWIMNFIFISLAIGSVIAGWRYFESFMLHRIVLVLFAISLILAAVFNHAPINPDAQYNIREDGWHSYFACTAAISFFILSIATSFIADKQIERIMAIAAGLSVIFLSVLMSEADWAAGIWQRLIFIIVFGWMIYSFRTEEI